MECQHIQHPECDLTADLASDSDYSIRVRAECNGQDSEWTPLNAIFNRRNSKTPPSLVVQYVLMVLFGVGKKDNNKDYYETPVQLKGEFDTT